MKHVMFAVQFATVSIAFGLQPCEDGKCSGMYDERLSLLQTHSRILGETVNNETWSETQHDDDCVTLHVGNSNNNINTRTATLPGRDYFCPSIVNRDNWLGGHQYGDIFKISQEGADVSVTRTDCTNCGWGMDLKFPCCKRPTKLPACLFLHGAMVKGAWPPQFKTWYGDVSGALRTYWGPFNIWYADLCSEFLYSWAETETHAWDNGELQISYADKAAEVINMGGVVFAHSMANAILAGACWQRQKCVQWYSLGGGYSGQAIGNAVLDVVRAVDLGSQLMNVKVYEGFNFEAHGMRHDPEVTNRNAMAKVVDHKKLLKGSICGIRATGAAWSGDTKAPNWSLEFAKSLEVENHWDQHVMGVAMGATDALVRGVLSDKGDDQRTDGLVEVAACAFWEDDNKKRHWYGTGSEWKTFGPKDDPTDTHILAEINHIEECGVFTQTPVAMNWIRNMMCNEMELSGMECPSKSIPMNWPAPSGKVGEACAWPSNSCKEGSCCSVNHHSICQHKQKDWLGVEYCPADCAGYLGFPGTCENEEITSLNHKPRKIGDPCIFDSDCAEWISGNPVGCCDKVCTRKKKDWAGIHWCPEQCVGSWWGNPGTC